MQKHFIIVILCLVTLLLACHKKEIRKKTVAQNTTSEKINTTPVIKDAIIDPDADIMDTGGTYNIDSLNINADILSVFVNYSGGCKDHSFELYSRGMYGKSLPPQLSLCLRHNNNGDACNELLRQELKFNIFKLKYPGKNTLILKLGDKQRITYISK